MSINSRDNKLIAEFANITEKTSTKEIIEFFIVTFNSTYSPLKLSYSEHYDQPNEMVFPLFCFEKKIGSFYLTKEPGIENATINLISGYVSLIGKIIESNDSKNIFKSLFYPENKNSNEFVEQIAKFSEELRTLRNSHKYLQAFFDTTQNSLILLDHEYHIILFNRYANSKSLEWFKKELVPGNSILDYINEEFHPGLSNLLNRAGEGDFPEIEKKLLKGDEEYWYQISVLPITEDNLIQSYFLMMTDITDKKNQQQKIHESEKKLQEINASKDKFFSIIAHDLRSPFHGLLGFSDLLRNNLESLSPEFVKHAVDNIHTTVNQLYKLIENLLNWSRSQLGRIEFNPSLIDISLIFEEVLQVLSGSIISKNILINNKIPKKSLIYADENVMKNILENILSNAVKFSYECGEVIISIKYLAAFVEISVEDMGTGISDEDLQKIFNLDTYYSTLGTMGEKGTGLGLLITKELVTLHKGEILIKSARGKGTTFTVRIPQN